MRFLFRCPGCDGIPDAESFPLCSICHQALVACPSLCPKCALPSCPAARDSQAECHAPWRSDPSDPLLNGFFARYLLVGIGYRLLRRWKVRRGPAFSRRILNADTRLLTRLAEAGTDVIIPLPQSYRRAWSLGGSPALEIAHWLSESIHVPLLRDALATIAPRPGELRQAELKQEQRLAHAPRITAGPRIAAATGLSILLVDDFMTTGRTLKTAARVLRGHGAREVRAFCLGLRPRLASQADESLAAGTEAIT